MGTRSKHPRAVGVKRVVACLGNILHMHPFASKNITLHFDQLSCHRNGAGWLDVRPK